MPREAVRADDVVLADDRLSVHVDFIGGPIFDPEDPCSVAYDGTAKIVGDELEIGIYARQHPKPLPPRFECVAEGHLRTITLALDEPFVGSVDRDLAGQVLLLEPPAGSAEIGGLPDDWELRREGNMLESSTPRWERVWSPDPDPWPAEGDSMLTLIQAFGGPVDTTGGERQPPVEVNGQPATFYLHAPTGAMVVVWSLADDELALGGYLRDFSRSEFVALAESVSLPSD